MAARPVVSSEADANLQGLDAAFLRPLPAVFMGLGLAIALGSPLWAGQASEVGTQLAIAYGAIGMFLVLLGLWFARAAPAANVAYPIVSLLAIMLLACDLLFVRVTGQFTYSSGLWLLLGSGLLILRTRYLHPVIAVAVAGWLVLFWADRAQPGVLQDGLVIVAGTTFAYAAHAVRVREIRRSLGHKQREAAARRELETALAASRETEARMRAITDSSPLGIFHTDVRGVVDYANARWSEIAGVDWRDFEAIRNAVHPDDREILARTWRTALATGKDLLAQFRYVHPDGSVRDVVTHAVPLRSAGGEVTGFAGTLQDVTERHRAEAEARKAAAEYRMLADNSPDLISRFDRQHRRLYANRTAAAVRGEKVATLVGRKLDEDTPSVPPAQAAEFMATIDRAFADHQTKVFEIAAQTALGPRTFETRIVPERSDDAAPDEEAKTVLVLSRDITDFKRTQADAAEARARLEEAQHISHVGSWEWDVATGAVAWSDEMYRLYGYPVRSFPVTFERAMERVLPEDQKRIRDDLQRALSTRNPGGDFTFDPVEYRVQLPDGSFRYMRGQGHVRHGPDGKPTRVLGTVQDVTEPHLREVKFRGLLDSAPDAMVIVDTAGRIVLVNGQTERLFGYPRAELLGHPADKLFPGHPGLLRPPAARTPRTEGGLEMEAVRQDGTRFPAEVNLSVLETPEGRLLCAAARDVTERQRAAEADRIAFERLLEIEQLKEMDRFKTQILNAAGHELNTPITPVKVQLHLLKSGTFGPLNPQQRQAVAILDRNLERLSTLVSDVLDVARLQGGRLRLDRKPLDVAQAVREAVESFEAAARDASVAVTWQGEPGTVVDADPLRLGQVLYNLLSNALKFTPAGGHVALEIVRSGAACEVLVRDNGHGLTREQMARLFQPFSQVHDTTRIRAGGTGLGLYISRGILEQHGGSLDVESDGPERGCTFRLRIPLAAAQQASAATASGSATATAAA